MSEVNLSLPGEIWKDIEGHENRYQVSDLGRVKSLVRFVKNGSGQKRTIRERVLSPVRGNKRGHLAVCLGRNNPKSIHRLVLLTFVGPCPNGMECCHNDGNPKNNKLENLRWDTKQANSADRHKHGTAFNGPKGNTHPFAKLNDMMVREIRADHAAGGWTLSKLSNKYNVHVMTLSDLLRGKTWKHVK